MTDTAGAPAPISTYDQRVEIAVAKEAKKMLARSLLSNIKAFEKEFDCRVVGISLEAERTAGDSEWRTAGVRVDVQL